MAISGEIKQKTSIGGGSFSNATGTRDHTKLNNKDVADQHPIEAITNLRIELDELITADTTEKNRALQAETNLKASSAHSIEVVNNVDYSTTFNLYNANNTLIATTTLTLSSGSDIFNVVYENRKLKFIRVDGTYFEVDLANLIKIFEDGIAQEATLRQSADSTEKKAREDAITAEQNARSKADEETLEAAKEYTDAETTRAETAEGALSDAISAEETRATTEEEGLSGRISTIEADYLKAADKTELSSKIDEENGRATAAEETLSTAIDKEVEDRTKAVSDALADAKKYTDDYGGKIDIIEVNGVEQTIESKKVNIIIPTKLTDLTNDGNFVRDANYVHTDNNFEKSYLDKLKGIEDGAQVNAVTAVAGKVGNVTLDKNDVGLDKVDNTADADKPVSTAVAAAIALVRAIISAEASAENPAADKAFVNSSIANNSANFIGTFNSKEELESYIGTITNNDYAYVKIMDPVSSFIKQYDRYKYNASQAIWKFEYTLNNSSFTAAQWATINSGITLEMVEELRGALKDHATKTEVEAVANALLEEVTRATGAEAGLQGAINSAVELIEALRADLEDFSTEVSETYATKAELKTTKETLEKADETTLAAAKKYTDDYGGKIDKIKVNGTEQTITNKEVDIAVPTALSGLSEDTTHRVVTDAEKTKWNKTYIEVATSGQTTPSENLAVGGLFIMEVE